MPDNEPIVSMYALNEQMKGAENPEGTRIFYVEPNDASGFIGIGNGNDDFKKYIQNPEKYTKENNPVTKPPVPLTPDYTKFCISFDLIVEKVSRMKRDGNEINKEWVIISWTSDFDTGKDNDSKDPSNLKISPVSFLQGQTFDEHDFLTTYYTDAHFNEIKKNAEKKTIEGLGIESVSLAFENWYCPVATIKFVDVRGSSLFGVEEHNHRTPKGEITADTVFGCFFTFPYPKFTLQLKGFYGQAVSYQLSCKSFKANFNSQTGNFEATASFIGYQYGILTDIPISYLVIAPECTYGDSGSAYWDMKTQDKPENDDWRLSNGQMPIKLRQLVENMNKALKGGAENNENQ